MLSKKTKWNNIFIGENGSHKWLQCTAMKEGKKKGLLSSRLVLVIYICITSFSPGRDFTFPILLIRSLRLKDIKLLAQGHKASNSRMRWESFQSPGSFPTIPCYPGKGLGPSFPKIKTGCFSKIHLQIGLELFFHRDNVINGGYILRLSYKSYNVIEILHICELKLRKSVFAVLAVTAEKLKK